MSDSASCNEKSPKPVKSLNEQLETLNKENERLKTKLQGYNKVGKFAIVKAKENEKLMKEIKELKSPAGVLEEHGPQKTSSDDNVAQNEVLVSSTVEKSRSNEGIKDLQSLDWGSTAVDSDSLSSSKSFSIIGSGSSNFHIPNIISCSHSKPCLDAGYQKDLADLNISRKTSLNNSDEIFLGDNKVRDNKQRDEWISNNQGSYIRTSPCESESQGVSIVKDFVQVFPETSQSGGSDFCSRPTFIDKEVDGGESCVNPSHVGPMSILDISYQYNVGLGPKEQVNKDTKENEEPNVKSFNVDVDIKEHDPYSHFGIGARPKQSKEFHTNYQKCEKSNEIKLHHEVSAEKGMKLKIPQEPDEYRINNMPMLHYGRDNSQTEISALTSFGSSLSNTSPEKGPDEIEFKVTLPKMIYPEIIIQKLQEDVAVLKLDRENLLTKTNKLQMVNKKWKDSWESLKKEKDLENYENVKRLTEAQNLLKKETENTIAVLKEKLHAANDSRKDLERENETLRAEILQKQQVLNQMSKDYGNLHHQTRALEIQLEGMKNSSPAREKVMQTSDLETELALAKKQVNLFKEDFVKENKEKKDCLIKLQKERELNRNLEAKLKNSHTMLKSRDNQLMNKSSNVSKLEDTIIQLKLKLEAEQRRALIYPSLNSPSSGIVYPVETSIENQEEPCIFPHQNRNNNATNFNIPPSNSLMWNCDACTFQNMGSDVRCDMCGTQRHGTTMGYGEIGKH